MAGFSPSASAWNGFKRLCLAPPACLRHASVVCLYPHVLFPTGCRRGHSKSHFGRSKLVCTVGKSLKGQYNDTLQEAYDLAALQSLRHQVELEGGNTEDADDRTLIRFLQAQSLDVEKAAKAFADHQNWRAEFVPNGYFTEADVLEELKCNKLYLLGQDKRGYPAIIVAASKHFHNKNDFDQFKRFVVYSLDKIMASAPPGKEKFVAIVDMKGLSVKNLDAKSLVYSFETLQSHYPGSLEKIWMINTPFIFNSLWKVVQPFISEEIQQSISFVDKKAVRELLLGSFDVDLLPKEHGGNADPVPIQHAVIPKWQSTHESNVW